MFETIVRNSPLLYFVQSVWRDEAFSILAAEQPLSVIIPKLSFEPPVYYTLLHFWIRIFGNSEVAVRSLSFLAFAAACVIVIEWSDKLFKKTYLAWLVPLLFLTNPMLLYYAFEIRTYGWYMFFAVLSMFAYSEKRQKLFVAATVLGFYTHSYFIFAIAGQVAHYALTHYKKLKSIRAVVKDKMVQAFAVSAVFIVPWILRIAVEASKLKDSWYFPVNLNLVKSVLGNMYFGYEGTPWYGWNYTAFASLILLAIFGYTFMKTRDHVRVRYLLISVFLPLIVVVGISFIKPLFVNRYLIPVTISMVLLLGYFLAAIPGKNLRAMLAVLLVGINVIINIWFPALRAKKPIRDTLIQVNAVARNGDLIYATSPLVFFETVYYAKDRGKVFLYNPKGGAFPWYVGDAIFSPERMISDLPEFPARAIFVNPDGTYSIEYRSPETK